ncbi:hypothetical protein EM308_15265 [Flavobacterium gilvum]|uniref:Lipoprotein n=2 Tax=Flavobacterium gilvum TaxID=1492737 RepID=A0AAC9I6J8_9FLAO|nr:hypothetical protein EM308_15265 [Flavobacterium gilvum]
MKYLMGILLLVFVSCGNKENILLPKTNKTIVKDVVDLSPIYIFFRVKGKDTLAEVNRKNSIGTTNWVLNIDRRLSLKSVIPEIIKLQEKKRGDSAHKNELAQNYYSYADTIGKNLAFIPFTNVFYKTKKPIDIAGFTFYFRKGNDLVLVNNHFPIKKSQVIKSFREINFENYPQIILIFDENMSYEEYIENKVLIYELQSLNKVSREFIF